MKINIYEEIKDEVLNCAKCDLGCDKPDDIDPHVMGEGNLDAKVMFIAEAPGKEETKYKQPLTSTGTAGKKFESVLKHLGLSREDVYVTNTVLCRPDGNADPMPYQVLACEDYFKRQLELVNPKIVVTFGRFAAQSMLGYIKITKSHGQIVHSDKFGVDVFPLYHPAYVSAYANADRRKEFKYDVKKLKGIIKEYMDENITDNSISAVS